MPPPRHRTATRQVVGGVNNRILNANVNPWDRLGAVIMLDAAREARKGDEEARAWLQSTGFDLLGALIPAEVEPAYVMERLFASQVPRH